MSQKQNQKIFQTIKDYAQSKIMQKFKDMFGNYIKLYVFVMLSSYFGWQWLKVVVL